LRGHQGRPKVNEGRLIAPDALRRDRFLARCSNRHAEVRRFTARKGISRDGSP